MHFCVQNATTAIPAANGPFYGNFLQIPHLGAFCDASFSLAAPSKCVPSRSRIYLLSTGDISRIHVPGATPRKWVSTWGATYILCMRAIRRIRPPAPHLPNGPPVIRRRIYMVWGFTNPFLEIPYYAAFNPRKTNLLGLRAISQDMFASDRNQKWVSALSMIHLLGGCVIPKLTQSLIKIAIICKTMAMRNLIANPLA